MSLHREFLLLGPQGRRFWSLSALFGSKSPLHIYDANKRTGLLMTGCRQKASCASSIQNRSLDREADTSNPSSQMNSSDLPVLKLNKVAVMGKMTRYEFEKLRYDGYSEEQFKQALTIRGSNYEILLEKHKKHLDALSTIIDVLKKRGIEYQICTRGHTTFTKDVVHWADAVITAGGDGTFLSAASKITDRSKPLIGLNTDPERSEGHLCLPAKYSANLDDALRKIEDRKFRWQYRQRIRITMTGTESNFQPIENGDILKARMKGAGTTYPDQHEIPINPEFTRLPCSYSEVLPNLALNEVFIGESLASVPSYYEFQIDGGPLQKQKSSGLCISTGTGSTAWSYNICRLHPRATKHLLQVTRDVLRQQNNNSDLKLDGDLVERVTDIYAQSFIFKSSDEKMLYSIRDPMYNKVYLCEKPHGFAKEILIRSRCWDAALCIDGGTSFLFNDGATVSLQVLPKDALRTIVLDET